MKTATLKKRTWAPVIDRKTGKWFTGFGAEGDEILEHEVRTLTVKPMSVRRGRSAANIWVADRDGYEYLVSLSGSLSLIKKLVNGSVKSDGEYITCDFVQAKQGANLFIEVVE